MKKWITARKPTVMLLAVWIMMTGLLAGCALGPEARKNSGTLKLSSEVSDIFQSYRVLPNHKYYYTGSDTKPQAIIGIDQKYTLETRLWKEAPDLTSEQLKKWVDQMLGFRPPVRTFGSYILSATGQQVGVWYSQYSITTVKVEADNQVMVYPPTPAAQPVLPRFLREYND